MTAPERLSQRASEQTGHYPRPQLIRADWLNLDGTWAFAYDDETVGIDQGWFDPDRRDRFDREIEVPYPPESVASGIGDPTFHPVVWYRRDLSGDELPRPASTTDRTLLHFGAVDFQAMVWFDGALVAEHVGGQTPFCVDVTDALTSGGDHVIVVRAHDDSRDPAQPTGKQDWKPEPHGIWYHRTTGIWQTVWVEVVPALHIVELVWTTDIDTTAVSCEVGLSAAPDEPVDVAVELSVGGETQHFTERLTSQRTTVSIDVGELAGAGHFDDLLWSPEHPTLVDARVSLRQADATDAPGDQVASYFGMRSVGVRDGHFLLNNQPYYLRAVLDQGYWRDSHLANPGTEWLRDEVALIKELGFNGARVHQKAEDPRFLYWTDRLGLLVWGETANARRFSGQAVALLTREWTELVRRDRSHPSIVTWVPMNESWGVGHIATRPRQQEYVAALVSLTRAIDPTRPVISNDGWEHVDSDILGIHDYASKARILRRRYGNPRRIRKTLKSDGPARRSLIITDEQWARFDTGDVPVMLTEFGGVSYAGDDGTWGYATVSDDAEYEKLLRKLFGAIRDCPDIVGFCYTQLLDTLQETNGLLTADREPKLAVATIRSIVTGLEA